MTDLSQNETSPHSFRPLRWWDALRESGRCRHCYLPRFAHPVRCWIPSRPMGDKTPASVSWQTLSGGR